MFLSQTLLWVGDIGTLKSQGLNPKNDENTIKININININGSNEKYHASGKYLAPVFWLKRLTY